MLLYNKGGVKMSDSGIASLIIGFVGSFFLVFIALYIFIVVANWKLFTKAGKPGWPALVPIYNKVILFEIIGYKWYYVFLIFASGIPIIGQVIFILFSISYSIKLARAFGQTPGFGIGLFFLSPIFTAIIAFSKNINYIGPSVNGDIDLKDLF